jgi:hypothetical protein
MVTLGNKEAAVRIETSKGGVFQTNTEEGE